MPNNNKINVKEYIEYILMNHLGITRRSSYIDTMIKLLENFKRFSCCREKDGISNKWRHLMKRLRIDIIASIGKISILLSLIVNCKLSLSKRFFLYLYKH